MSTRSIVAFHGASNHGGAPCTVRVYKHSDGYPTDNLRVLAETTARVEAYIGANAERVAWLARRPDGLTPGLDEVPARMFADAFVASTLYWTGCSARLDTDLTFADDAKVSREAPAVYGGPFYPAHLGMQGDLEWVYVVDIRARTITVYGGDYGVPAEHLERGPVDPRSYADQLRPEFKGDEYAAISAHMDKLTEQGWTITPPAKPKKARARKARATS